MKLSEALHEGRKQVKTQVTRKYLDHTKAGALCGCATGAMAVGAGFKPESGPINPHKVEAYLREHLPQLWDLEHGAHISTFGSILMLNDREHRTMRQIQLWLEERGL